MLRVPRVARRGRGQHGKLGGVGLAQHDRPGLLQPADAGGVIVRHKVGIDRRAHGRFHPGGKENVFQADWDAVQQPPVVALPDGGVARLGLGQGRPGVERDPGPKLRLQPLNTLKTRADQFNR